MASKDDNGKVQLEELRVALPDEAEAEQEITLEDREAMDAIRKFTDEDEDDMGEISIKSILGGDFLMSRFMLKQVMFVMFCVLLMILYTGNRYGSQQDAILIDSLRGHLQDVKYNVLTQSSELMNMMRQSNVERRLQGTRDSLLHNSITPPFLIKTGKGDARDGDEDIEEVLVDSMAAPAGTQKQKPAVQAENKAAAQKMEAGEPEKQAEEQSQQETTEKKGEQEKSAGQ